MGKVKTVTIPLATFELMHLAIVDYKFWLCEPGSATRFRRDVKLAVARQLQADNQQLFAEHYGPAQKRRTRVANW